MPARKTYTAAQVAAEGKDQRDRAAARRLSGGSQGLGGRLVYRECAKRAGGSASAPVSPYLILLPPGP